MHMVPYPISKIRFVRYHADDDQLKISFFIFFFIIFIIIILQVGAAVGAVVGAAVGSGVTGAGVTGAGVTGAGVTGAGVNGAGVTGAGVTGAEVTGTGAAVEAAIAVTMRVRNNMMTKEINEYGRQGENCETYYWSGSVKQSLSLSYAHDDYVL